MDGLRLPGSFQSLTCGRKPRQRSNIIETSKVQLKLENGLLVEITKIHDEFGFKYQWEGDADLWYIIQPADQVGDQLLTFAAMEREIGS